MLKVKCTVILAAQKTIWKNRSRRRKESTQDIAFSISPAALQYGISSVFITCDECL
jgi:hypothetical protein